jgi:hypothetical protein
VSSIERAYLRRLAEQVLVIAAQPKQKEKRDLWYLRHLIYRDQKLPDDFVVAPELWVTRPVRWDDWGLVSQIVRGPDRRGSWVYDPPLKDPADLRKLSYPMVEVDE